MTTMNGVSARGMEKERTSENKASFKERCKAYIAEVANIYAPGVCAMNGGAYRPSK